MSMHDNRIPCQLNQFLEMSEMFSMTTSDPDQKSEPIDWEMKKWQILGHGFRSYGPFKCGTSFRCLGLHNCGAWSICGVRGVLTLDYSSKNGLGGPHLLEPKLNCQFRDSRHMFDVLKLAAAIIA